MEQNCLIVYQKFDEFINLIVNKELNLYPNSNFSKSIKDIVDFMKIIYNSKIVFEYVFERYYSNNRNPFTTAYHEFMNYLNSGFDTEDSFNFIANYMFERLLREKINNNEFIVYK